MTEADDRYRAPALDKGLDILELLGSSEESLSQIEIAKALDRSSSEIFRMLDRLVRRGYVRRTDEDRYALTLRIFELAHRTPPMRRLISGALPIMRAFARETEQECHLVSYDKNALVVIAQVDAPGYWSVSIRVGSRIGLLDTGSGHVFLAHAAEDERQVMLETATARRPGRDLDRHLEEVRRQGFERMASQQVPGVTNLAVPVFGPLGPLIAAIACPYVTRLDRTNPIGIEETLARLVAAANAIAPAEQGSPEALPPEGWPAQAGGGLRVDD